MPNYILGLDASHWNTPNFPALVAAGHKFCWIKVSEGPAWLDAKYVAHRLAARSAGLVTGPYHYFRAAWGGATQAQHFFDNAYNDTLPPAVDVEAINNTGFTKDVFKTRLRECLLKTEELFGRRPIIYTSKSKWELLVGLAGWESMYDLWVAHYSAAANAPLLPNGWANWAVWQYTSIPLDTDRMQEAYWNSLNDQPPIGTVTITIAKSTADDLRRALA